MPRLKNRTSSSAEQVKKSVKEGKARVKPEFEPTFDKVVSTGSTLLDLAISGKRIRGGGLPGGILVEIAGPSSAGKTALLCEIAASVQIRGGDAYLADTEARIDPQYASVYDFLLEDRNLERPDTVDELFGLLLSWKPEPKEQDAISMFGADSMAALSTEMELESDDKMGMKRAKDFSKGCRKSCVKIQKNNWLVVFTNQERQGNGGSVTTPCGNAIPFHASLRLRVYPQFPNSKVVVKKKIGAKDKEISAVKGIISLVTVKKSSLDEPFRTVPLYIMFNTGIDDVRANLQWQKDMLGLNKYLAVDKEFAIMERAISYIEDNDLEDQLREQIIDLWEDIQKQFDTNRKKKKRR